MLTIVFAFTTGMFLGIVLTIVFILLWNNREKRQLLKNMKVLEQFTKELHKASKEKTEHFPPISGVN
jgi:uncharacterized membrane-anchored protein YhcB (DUF1043 family)